jgi:hypothetical protein
MRRNEAASIEENLKTVKSIKDTRETLLEQVKAKATSNGWKKIPSRFNLDALVALQETVDDLSSQFGDSFQKLRWLPELSLKSLEQELAKVESLLKDLQEKTDARGKASEALEKVKDKKDSSEAQLQLLDRFLAYHDEPGAFLLKGLATTLETRKIKLAQMKAAQALVRGIDTKPPLCLNLFRQARIRRETRRENGKGLKRGQFLILTYFSSLTPFASVQNQFRFSGSIFCV